jgi:hypothetical protein
MGGLLHRKREKGVSHKSSGNILIIFPKSVMWICFYPKFLRVGNGSSSGLKLLLKVTSVKWKECDIYSWP